MGLVFFRTKFGLEERWRHDCLTRVEGNLRRRAWYCSFGIAWVLCFLSVDLAYGVQWEVRSETSAQVYRLLDSDRQPVERLRFAEVLNISAMTTPRADVGFYFARTLLRMQMDTGVSAAFADTQPGIQPTRTDILGASLQGIGLAGGKIDFEAGRFIRLDSLGFAMVDGASVDLHTPWRVGLGVLAGMEPTETRDALTWNPFRLDGFAETEDEPNVMLYGMSLFSRDLGMHTVRVDAREWRDTDSNIRGRQLGGSLRLAYPGTVFFDVDARLDLIDMIMADMRTRALVPVSTSVDLELRYLRLVPVFDTMSIFGIYPRYPLQELSFGGRLRLSPQWTATARASTRVVEDARGTEVEPGAHVGATYSAGRQVIMGSLDHFDGPTGTWDLALVQGSTPVLMDKLVMRCGLTFLKVEDSVNPGLETWGGGGHMSLDYDFAPGWMARAYVEDHETRLEKRAVRGMVMLTTTLGSGPGGAGTGQ